MQEARERLRIWLTKYLNYFDPLQEREEVNEALRIKAFTELVFMYNMFELGEAFPGDLRNKVKNKIFEVVEKFNGVDYAVLRPGFLPVPAIICEFLKRNGLSSAERSLEKIEHLIKCGADRLNQKTPYRLLDVRYSLTKGGLSTRLEPEMILYAKTIIGKKMNPLLLNDDAAYAITHTVFYVSDMGRKEPQIGNKVEIVALLQALITYYQLAFNADILGELIIALLMLDRHFANEACVKLAMASLLQDQDGSEGFFRSPGYVETKREEKKFFDNYHTSMVALGAMHIYEKSLSRNNTSVE